VPQTLYHFLRGGNFLLQRDEKFSQFAEIVASWKFVFRRENYDFLFAVGSFQRDEDEKKNMMKNMVKSRRTANWIFSLFIYRETYAF
jgi:hypothetical protein